MMTTATATITYGTTSLTEGDTVVARTEIIADTPLATIDQVVGYVAAKHGDYAAQFVYGMEDNSDIIVLEYGYDYLGGDQDAFVEMIADDLPVIPGHAWTLTNTDSCERVATIGF